MPIWHRTPALAIWLIACTPLPHETARCVQTARQLVCTHETLVLPAGSGEREVHYQVPSGDPLSSGFPAVLLFQGALFSGEGMWQGTQGAAVGAYHQTRTVEQLLEHGFAVVTPEAAGDGLTAWNTNVPPHAGNWEASPDAELLDGIFASIDAGDFGPVDADALYAAGISSGGYMTSRMAQAYPGRFDGLAIHSASWATCAGAVCAIPDPLPEDHPPTLFLHGGLDGIVPPGSSRRYARRLEEMGVDTDRQAQPLRTHRWLDIAPDAIVTWFESYPPT
ncbi:MAG: plasmid partitioning protein [Proteobacteria bacterium]|nr:plasmid partitioning protein [Pseudomonadota bacterium]